MASSRLVRQRRLSIVIGGLVVVVFLAMLGFAVTAGNGVPGTSRRSVKVAFTDVGALRKGDDVRIAGIRVGKVDRIALEGGRAVVTLSLDGNRAIYRDASAVNIAQRSALGQAYVNVSPGTPSTGTLPRGQLIVEDAKNSAQDLTNVLDVLNAHTRKSLQSLVREVGDGASGHGADVNDALAALPHALPDLGTVSDALSGDGGSNLTALLTETHALATSFAGQQKQLAALTSHLQVTLSALGTDNGAPIAAALRQAPGTLTAVRAGLGALTQPLRSTTKAVSALQAGARSLGEATPALRAVLRDGVGPLKKVPGVAAKAVGPVQNLTTVLHDARPLAPRVARAIEDASTPLAILAPYSPEMSLLFSYLTSALGDGDSAGHWLRFYVPLNTESVDGTVPIRDPITKRDAYPAPGVGPVERSTTILGSRK